MAAGDWQIAEVVGTIQESVPLGLRRLRAASACSSTVRVADSCLSGG